MNNKITTLIFDLGGVIINIDPSLTIKILQLFFILDRNSSKNKVIFFSFLLKLLAIKITSYLRFFQFLIFQVIQLCVKTH